VSEQIRMLIFAALGVLTLGSAFVVAFAGRIVHSVFALLFTFLGVGGLYALLFADFLAGAQLLVYVGGILVLLLFGVMLTQKIEAVDLKKVSMQRGPAAVISLGLLGVLLFVVYTTPWQTGGTPPESTVQAIGTHLMTDYLLPFEVISVLLLGVLVAAAMMARREVRR
jgi:NADH:ubiquinone oxidoreductase subunit 6 (subunit J)